MRIRRLHLADVALPPGHPRHGQPCPVYAYLVDHPDGPILFDTGVAAAAGRLTDALAGVDVALVVNSHLHFDHCGNNPSFPGVPLVAQRAEYLAAQRPRYTLPGVVEFPGARWELVDGEAEIAAGVRVLPTPGHTSGHQSLVVGGVVLAGQAVYDPGELEAEESAEPLPPDEATATSASARLIKALRPARVLFAHDPGEWTPS